MADVDALEFAVFGKLLPDPGLVIALGNGGEVERELLSLVKQSLRQVDFCA